MNKISLDYSEFYITNVCNLDCPQCNRFNNRKFKGHYFFDESLYAPWAEKLDLVECAILGGEPTLNPGLASWITSIRKLWPNVKGNVTSNGTNLNKVPGLANALAESNWELVICVHNVGMRNYVLDQINSTFGQCRFSKLMYFQDSVVNGMEFITPDGIVIKVTNGSYFYNNVFQDGHYQLHDSDPEAAHRVCMSSKCHHFIDGKLYKCGVVALLPEYYQQSNKAYPELYDQYQPLVVSDVTQDRLTQLTESAIPQCKFCPSDIKWMPNQSKFKSKILNIRVLNHQG